MPAIDEDQTAHHAIDVSLIPRRRIWRRSSSRTWSTPCGASIGSSTAANGSHGISAPSIVDDHERPAQDLAGLEAPSEAPKAVAVAPAAPDAGSGRGTSPRKALIDQLIGEAHHAVVDAAAAAHGHAAHRRAAAATAARARSVGSLQSGPPPSRASLSPRPAGPYSVSSSLCLYRNRTGRTRLASGRLGPVVVARGRRDRRPIRRGRERKETAGLAAPAAAVGVSPRRPLGAEEAGVRIVVGRLRRDSFDAWCCRRRLRGRARSGAPLLLERPRGISSPPC